MNTTEVINEIEVLISITSTYIIKSSLKLLEIIPNLYLELYNLY